MHNSQLGPVGSADLLADVVRRASYKPGWTLTLKEMERHGEHLAGGYGLTLSVRLECEDSTKPGEKTHLHHLFAVPPASYNRETWERWVLDCLIQVETHEALEWFKVDGWAPFFPPHGYANGNSPYTIQRRSEPRPEPLGDACRVCGERLRPGGVCSNVLGHAAIQRQRQRA